MSAPLSRRRPVLAVIGAAGALPPATETLALELGQRAIAAGFRVVTGGLSGVMEAVSRGAHLAPEWREGDVLGVLPSYDRTTANRYVDVAIPTGLQLGRNVIVVAMADVVVALGGGAGTLSELALAWQLGKPLVALASAGGWAEAVAGQCLDARSPAPITRVDTAVEAIAAALRLYGAGSADPGEIGSGWRASRS